MIDLDALVELAESAGPLAYAALLIAGAILLFSLA